MLKLEVRGFISAGHQLPLTEHLVTKECHHYHGHTYGIIATFYAPKPERAGMVVDFKAIKDLMNNNGDHGYFFTKGNPDHEEMAALMIKHVPDQPITWLEKEATAENIAEHLRKEINAKYPDLQDVKIELCEGYKGQEGTSWVVSYEE